MCGLAGVLTASGRSQAALADCARRMIAPIAHRGPDYSGLWTDETAGLALGFRRLAILDLSPLGHQPMRSPSGRYVAVFNGEIYNFRELRHELDPPADACRGSSGFSRAAVVRDAGLGTRVDQVTESPHRHAVGSTRGW